jgi:hypothetical protein
MRIDLNLRLLCYLSILKLFVKTFHEFVRPLISTAAQEQLGYALGISVSNEFVCIVANSKLLNCSISAISNPLV